MAGIGDIAGIQKYLDEDGDIDAILLIPELAPNTSKDATLVLWNYAGDSVCVFSSFTIFAVAGGFADEVRWMDD